VVLTTDYLPSCRKSHLFATGMIPACAWNDLGRAVFTVRGSKNGSLE
jgi:hypothetical protein